MVGDCSKVVYQLHCGARMIAWASQEKNISKTSYASGWKVRHKNVKTFAPSEAFFNTLSTLHLKTI